MITNAILNVVVKDGGILDLDQNVDGFSLSLLDSSEVEINVKPGGIFTSCENALMPSVSVAMSPHQAPQ